MIKECVERMGWLGLAVLIWTALAALWLLRHALFFVLVFLRPVVTAVFSFVAASVLLALILGLWVAHDKHHMLWGFFGLGVISTAILYFYDALVLMLAPGRFPLFLAR